VLIFDINIISEVIFTVMNVFEWTMFGKKTNLFLYFWWKTVICMLRL